ncbi:MAG: hypothetical protein ACXWRE_04825 [Pseudobdellovibrionaceae bacterium]
MKFSITILCLLLTSKMAFARPYPSTGNDINCNLEVYNISEFIPCDYEPSCGVSTSQVAVTFQSLKGSLKQRLKGTVSVKDIRGFHESNGGPISNATRQLMKLIAEADLNLEIDYSNPHLTAILSSNDADSFNLHLIQDSDMSEGKRNSGVKSTLVKLKSTQNVKGGIFGQLSCSPTK